MNGKTEKRADRIAALVAEKMQGVKMPRRRSRDLEHREQVALFRWAKLHERKYPELALMFAIPNAAKRSLRLGARMKAEGLKSGVPDIFLPVARAHYGGEWEPKLYHGLFIELKAGKGTATEKQTDYIIQLREQGYCAMVAYGWERAKDLIERYIGIQRYSGGGIAREEKNSDSCER